ATSPTRTAPPSLHDALPICRMNRGSSNLNPSRDIASLTSIRSIEQYAAGAETLRMRRNRGFPYPGLIHPDWPQIHVFPRRQLSRSEEHTSELQSRENLVCRL